MLHMCACVLHVCVCVCVSRTWRLSVAMESLAKALKDVTKTFGVAKVFAVANQKQICKRQMASVKSEMASGKWEVGVKGQPALFNLMSS